MPAKNRPDLKTADWKTLRLAILQRDAHTCAYCGAEADTVDHIIPASMGVLVTVLSMVSKFIRPPR